MENSVYIDALAADISMETNFDKETAKDYLETLFETVAKTLESSPEETVQIRDFGNFFTVFAAERVGRNLHTGEPLTVPAHRAVHFTPSKLLANSVNANYAHLSAKLVAANYEASGGANEQAAAQYETPVKAANLAKHERHERSGAAVKDERGGGKGLFWILLLLLLAGLLFALWYLSGRGSEATITADQPVVVEAPPVVTPLVVTPEPVTPLTPSAVQFSAHSVKAGDTLWGIAQAQWADSGLWSVLLHDNTLSDPDNLEIGSQLNVRAKPDLANAETKRLLEEAALGAYARYKEAGKNAKSLWTLYSGKKQYGLFDNWDDYAAISATDRDKLKSLDR